MLKPQPTQVYPSGEIIATNVSYESFLKDFDGQSVEWVNGVVIKMSPVSIRHDGLTAFLRLLFATYLELTNGGRVFQDPMVMRARPDLPGRSPDIQVVLPTNFGIIRENESAGPADLVVEIVSPESHRRDRVEKFAEYEQGGVKEYWVTDPIRQETLFYVLGEDGLYQPRNVDNNGIYRSVVLSRLTLNVAVLWQSELPSVLETVEMVKTMLNEDI